MRRFFLMAKMKSVGWVFMEGGGEGLCCSESGEEVFCFPLVGRIDAREGIGG